MHEQMKRLYLAAKILKGTDRPSDVAKLLNASQQTLKNWESRGISKGGMLDAQRAVGCSAIWLEFGGSEMPVPFGGDAIESTARRILEDRLLPLAYTQTTLNPAESMDQNAEPAGRPRTVRPVKIRGFAKMGEGGYYEEIDCDGWVESYSPDPDAYGLRVKGDSMHPAIRNGSVVVIEPRGQLVPGEYVAIALTDGRKMVKELVYDRADEIVVESVNGNHRQTIERRDIQTIHPVVAVVSPSKWRAE